MANGLLYLNTTTYNAQQSPFEVTAPLGVDTLTIPAGDKLTIAGSLDVTSTTLVGGSNINANSWGSGAATNGQVLTANGAGAATWAAVPGASESLDDAYVFGNIINVKAADGSVTIQNNTNGDATNTLTVGRAPAGATAGVGIDLSMGANTTGVGVNVLAAGTGDAAFINNTGTGSALTVQDGGTDVLDITATGAFTVTTKPNTNLTLTAANAGIVSIGADAGGVTVDTSGAVRVDADAASHMTVAGADLTLSTTGAGNTLINSALEVDITSATLDTNQTGSITMDAAATSHFTVTGAAADATVSSVGGSVNMTASEAAADAINITASAGAGGITASSGTGGITETTTGTMDLNSGPFTLDGTTGSIDFTDATNVTVTGASKDLTVASTGGSVNVTATEAAADAINITASAGAGGITASSGTGGIAATTTGTMDLNSGPFTLDGSTGSLDFTDTTNVTVTGASKDLTLGATGGSINITATENAVDALNIQATTGGVQINAAGLLNVDAGASADFDVTGSTTMTSTVATTIEAVGGNLTLDNQFATGKLILMTGTNTAATAVEIKSDNGTVQVSVDGTGQADFTGNLDANNGLDVIGADLTVAAAVDLNVGANNAIIDGTTGNIDSKGHGEFDGALGADGNLRIGAAGANKMTVNATTGDTYMSGNLTVDGDIISIGTTHMTVEDNIIELSVGYTTAVARPAGMIANYLPLATNDTLAANFVAGINAVSNPYVGTVGAATFGALVGHFIMFSGTTSGLNNGIFEVLSHAANVLTVRGVGLTATVDAGSRNQFIAQAAAGTVFEVTVSEVRAGTDGLWEEGSGNVTPLTYTDLATTASTTLQKAYENGNAVSLTNAEGNLAITTTAAGGGADLTVASAAGNFLATSTGTATMNLGAAANTVNFNGPETHTSNSTINLGSGQLTTAGNMDVSNGIDMTGGVDLTLSGAGTDLFAADSTAIKLGNTAVAPDATIGSDGTDMVTTMAATANCVVKTGDAAGAKSFIVADSGAVPQMTVTSDGDLTITGTATIPTGESLKVGDVFLNEYGSGMQGKNTSLVPIVAGDTVKFNGSGNFEISGTPGLTGMSDIPVGVAAVNIGVGLWGNVYFSGPAVPVKDNSGGGLLAGGFAIFDTAGGVKNIAAGAAAGKELVYGGACSKIAGGMAYISLVIQKIAKV